MYHLCRRRWQWADPPIHRGYRPHPELSGLWGLHGIRLKDFDLSALTAVHPHLKGAAALGRAGKSAKLLRCGSVPGADRPFHLRPVRLRRGRPSHPRADTRASLVLDDQPAGDGSTSGKAALERQAGNGPADHQAPKAGVVGAKSGQSLPGLGRCGAYSLPPLRKRQPVNTARPAPC